MKNAPSFLIAGTTRDTIEDELVIGGIGFDLLTRQNS
jgi:tRNA U34 5-carboxymethylaminomethyl modifying GTPase MnmE/TrmE